MAFTSRAGISPIRRTNKSTSLGDGVPTSARKHWFTILPFCPVCSVILDDGAEVCPLDGALLVEADPLVGQTLDGKYRVDARLGAGGMGAVYRGTQIALQRPVAIKVILGSGTGLPLAVRRFEQEALAVARLRHPHIVAVHDYGVASNVGAYLVMEFLEGRSLRDEIRRRGRVPVREALEWFAQICSAVHAAHTAGLVHRDLKPENIVLEPSDDQRIAKVLDFGIAKFISESDMAVTPLTGSGGIVGTPYYMSPEQCRGEPVGPASDIYALGCVLYELLTGRPPFRGESTHSLLYQHVSVAPPPPSSLAPDLPGSLDAAILKALAKDPADRFASVTELRVAVGIRVSGALVENLASLDTLPLAENDSTRSLAGAWIRVPNNLPAEVSRFVGRVRDVADGQQLLGTTRLLTVTGPGGIGKTRLVLQVVARTSAEYADGVWIADFGELSDPDHVDRVVASVFGLGDESGRTAREVLIGYLRSRRALIVLDNCEHLIARCASIATALLRGCPGLTLVASSREPLSIDGETVLQLDPLPVAAPEETHTAEAALDCDAIRLFVDRARLARPQWSLSDEDAHLVATICHRLDGIPLAIELAAARVKALSVTQILERLDGLAMLSGGGRSAPARHQTLEATIDWSYNLLEDDERRLMRHLAVFAGGWNLEAAEVVASLDSVGLDAVFPCLEHLVEKSLVVMEDRQDGARYRMLETIRSFAAARLRESGDADRIAARHRAWVIATVERAFSDFGGANHERWHRQVSLEHRNALTALEWGRRGLEDPVDNLRLAVSLGAYWETYGFWILGRQWLEDSLSSCPEADGFIRARAYFRLASIAQRQSDYSRAESLSRQCLELLRGTDKVRMLAETLTQLGRCVGSLGRFDEERTLLLEALEMHRQAGTPITIASTLQGLGSASIESGEFAQADRWLLESLEMFRHAGFSQGIAVALLDRAKVALAIGDAQSAHDLAVESLSVARAGDFEIHVAQSQRIVAEALIAQGEVVRARASLGDALRRARNLGAVDDVLRALEGSARLAAASGDQRLALKLACVTARQRDGLGDPLPEREREAMEALRMAACSALGNDEAESCISEASALAFDDAVSLVLEGSGTGR